MNLNIVNVEKWHLKSILEIEKACFSLPWTAAALENQMKSKDCIFIAAVQDNKVLGYAGLMSVLDEGYISNIAVEPNSRRQGIAFALIAELVNRTQDKLSFISLELRESNKAAAALYKKHGFVRVGTRKNYYDKPKEDAVLMTLFFKAEVNNKCL